MTLLTTGRLFWDCVAYTAKPESAPRGRFLITKISPFRGWLPMFLRLRDPRGRLHALPRLRGGNPQVLLKVEGAIPCRRLYYIMFFF